MIRKLGQALVVVALVVAVGGHWAVLQTVAWTTMLANNLSTEQFGEAVTKTFDGRHPCTLCKVVSEGKKAEKKAEFPGAIKKLEFTTDHPEFVFASPQTFWLRNEFVSDGESLTCKPQHPPPRSFSV